MAKKMTIEDLAQVMQRGFKESDMRTDKKIDDLAQVMQRGFKESDMRTDKKIDDLAGMVQKGFEGVQNQFDDIRGQMATKEELRETREVLARAIKDLESHLAASMSYNREQIDQLRNWMENIETRVAELEAKLSRKK